MKYITITSLSNPLIKETLKLKKRSDRRGPFLIEGPHLIEMALAAKAGVQRVFFTEEFFSKREGQLLVRSIAKGTTQLIETSLPILSKIADTETPQGIIALVSCPSPALDEINFKAAPLLVVCDGIQDPGNLGTIIRAADAAGADAVIILPGTCDPFMPKAIRATAGSLFNIPVTFSEPEILVSYLDSRKIALCAADVHASSSVYDVDLSQPVAVVFGNEARGVSGIVLKKATIVAKIPIIGKAESLNVAMAASVCLYEAVRQRFYK